VVLARPSLQLATIVVLAALVFLSGVATQPLDGDPAMYATIAKTIAHTGEWLHLTFNGEPYLNKPPLHFWLNALVFRALGPSTFTACLLPGLLGVVDAVLLYLVCRLTLAGWESAFAAALVYLTTPEVLHWGRGVHLETLVTAWVLVGIAAAYRSVAQPAAVLALGVACLGGGLSKGPQGLFPAAVALALWAREGILRPRLLSPWTVLAASLVLAGGGAWVWVRVAEGSGFAGAYFGGQIEKTLLEGGELQRGPLWYLGKLVRSHWPWLPVTAVGLVLLARDWRASLGARLWLVYAAVVMLVISLAVGKKSRYLFQLYPALSVAAGVALQAATRRFPRLPALLVACASAAAILVAALGGERVSAEQAAHTRDAIEIAAALPPARPIWITRAVQYAEPQLGKIVGFYARPLLRTCRAECEEEGRPGAVVIARAGEAERVAVRHGGEIVRRNPSLAVVVLPGGPIGKVEGRAAPPPHSR